LFVKRTPEEQVEIVFNDSKSIRSANLKPATTTIFLIDGFTAPPLTPMALETKDSKPIDYSKMFTNHTICNI